MSASRRLVLTDVAVVDTADGSVTPGRDVLVEDGVIASVTTTGGDVPADVDVAPGEGRYLVPGFVDMHAHPLNDKDPARYLRLMLAFGVTGFRQMMGTDDLVARRNAGRLDLPDDSPALLSLPGPLLSPMNAATPAAAVAEVIRQADLGVDFIKTIIGDADVLAAAQAAARRRGLTVAGHLPERVDVRAVSHDGFRSIEHVGPGIAIPSACSTDGDAIQASLGTPSIRLPSIKVPFMDRLMAPVMARIVLNPAQLTKPGALTAMRRAIDTFDEDRARELAAVFVQNGTWQCPTLIRIKTQELADLPEHAADPDVRLVPPAVRTSWTHAAERFGKKFTAEQHAVFADQYALQRRIARIFADEGVGTLAGTDAVGAVWVVAGSSLHREFDELAGAGLTPLKVLQSTTRDAATFLGDDGRGEVAVGKAADLVLLDGDPTTDVTNLHRVSSVVRAGRHLSSEALAALKAA